jgi:prepilin peptidase CpaA
VPASELVLWPLVAVAVTLAAAVDLKRGTVPWWVSWPALVLSLLARGIIEGVGSVDQGLVSGLLGALGCAVPFALLALTGPRVGWDDVKLLAAVGAGLGIPKALSAAFLISIAGAVSAVLFVLVRRQRSSKSRSGALDGVDSARSIPYGVPIAIGAFWAMAWTGPTMTDSEGRARVEITFEDGGVTGEEVEQPALE